MLPTPTVGQYRRGTQELAVGHLRDAKDAVPRHHRWGPATTVGGTYATPPSDRV